jgi:hypothetical protein
LSTVGEEELEFPNFLRKFQEIAESDGEKLKVLNLTPPLNSTIFAWFFKHGVFTRSSSSNEHSWTAVADGLRSEATDSGESPGLKTPLIA